MSATIAIVAALPREIAALVRHERPDRVLLRRGISLYRLPSAIVVAAGMGATRVALAVQAALAAEPALTTLVSAGLAGSCSSELAAGSVVEASLVIDVRTGERFGTASWQAANTILATTAGIASVDEKARIAATYRASAVDMEAATVARLALAHRRGVRAIKAISDAHDFELASLAEFEGKNGTFRTTAFAVHTALRPDQWGRTMLLGRNSKRALAALDQALRQAIAQTNGAALRADDLQRGPRWR